jgi:hypothetical protein
MCSRPLRSRVTISYETLKPAPWRERRDGIG